MTNRYGQVSTDSNWQQRAAIGTHVKANDRSLGLYFQRSYHFNRNQKSSSSKSLRVINSNLLVLYCCAVVFTVNLVKASGAQNLIKAANGGRKVMPSTSAAISAAAVAGVTASATSSSGGAPMADVIAIKEGADLDLSCPIVLPNEDMIISWTCENELANVRSSRIHVTETGKLRIRSAMLGDSCNYRCEAADGFATLSVIIKVIIIDKLMMDQIGHQNQTVPSAVSLQKPAAVNQSQHDPLATKLLKSVAQQNDAYPRALHYGTHVNGSFDQHHQSDEQWQQQPAELEIQVEPKVIRVDRNRTFSLECRVKHAPHLIAPQIIWLKEFIGQKPDSLREAHELNLVLIDNVYYHSLNWPRSNTYSQNTARANSALLVRQSNFVHSGNYICFAGYAPAIMSFNLSLNAGSENSDHDQRTTTITTQLGRGKSATFVRNSPPIMPLKYKMAVARVQVNDKEGEARHKQMLEAVSAVKGSRGLPEQSLLIEALLTNTWKRNFSGLLLILCGILCISKFVYTRYYLGESSKKSQELRAANQQIVESTQTIGSATTNNNLRQAYTPQLAVKQIQSSPNYSSSQPSHISRVPNTNGLEPVGTGSTSYRRHRQPDSESCSRELDEEEVAPTRLHQQETDHLYNEIGERFNATKQSRILTANNSRGNHHQIYETQNNYNRDG